jgi:hypothetical protein
MSSEYFENLMKDHVYDKTVCISKKDADKFLASLKKREKATQMDVVALRKTIEAEIKKWEAKQSEHDSVMNIAVNSTIGALIWVSRLPQIAEKKDK